MSSNLRNLYCTAVNRITVSCSLLAAAALVASSVASSANRAPQPNGEQAPNVQPIIGFLENRTKFLPGELVVRLSPGANAEELAATMGAHVQRRLSFAPYTYVFDSVPGSVTEAAEQVKNLPGVIGATPNFTYRPSALPRVVPNDPLYNQQWAMRLVNAPNFWGVTVGERLEKGPVRQVTVGVIDSGFATSHPDLQENIDTNAFDFINQQPYDETAVGFLNFFSHGTISLGCIAAATNNTEGIASLPWEAVKVLPCHAGSFTTVSFNSILEPFILSSAAVDAIYFCIQQNVDVINMGFGFEQIFFPVTDPLLEQAIDDAYNQGIVLVASSGNDRTQFLGGIRTAVAFPASLPQVIPVGAVGPAGELAFYSDGGDELRLRGLVAPGGNDSTFLDVSREIVSTDTSLFNFLFLSAGYGYNQGTTLAAAHVSSAIATLITQGAQDESLPPTLQVEQMRALLTNTARSPVGSATNDFGAGILDVEAALRQVSQVIDINAPTQNEVTESFSEPLEARIGFPINEPLEPGDFEVFQNDSDITSETEILDPLAGTIQYEPDALTRYSIGINRFNIRAINPRENPPDPADRLLTRSLEGPSDGRIPARGFRFRVIPHVEQIGLKMISVPYELKDEAKGLTFLTGGNLVRLARWVPDQNRYAIFDTVGSPQDPEAQLDTTDAGVAQPPIGVGFWSRIVSQTQFQVLGRAERTGSYAIPLKAGFNQIGNPYNFRVPFNVCSIQYGNELLSITEAVQRRLIRSVIWRYQDGRYTFQALPNGEFVEWESHWVQATISPSDQRPLILIVPRLPSNPTGFTLAAPSGPKVAGGWKSGIRAAVANGRAFGEVFLGAAGAAKDGYGDEDVANPPSAAGAGELHVAHRDWGRYSAGYAQDIRRAGGRLQSWNLEVATSKPGTPVKLTWDRFPARTRAFLRVEGTGATYDLTRTGSAVFSPKDPRSTRVSVVALAAPGA